MPLFGPPDVQKLIDKRDLGRLAKTLADEDPQRREQAARGLIQLSDPTAVPKIAEVLLEHQDGAVLDAGVGVLRAMGRQAVPTLLAGLRAAAPQKRAGYAALLGRMGEAYGLEPLLEISRDPEPAMRSIAAMALGLINNSRSVARLAEMVAGDDDVQARGYAGFSMAQHKLSGAYDTLFAQLDSDDPANRAIAAMNLGVLGDPRATDRIRELADSDGDQRVRDQARESLEKLEG